MWISPNYQLTDFTRPLSIDDKINVFFDRTMGWQLDIANKVINGERDDQANVILEPIKHSAFAALSIVLSYFEMIARYQNGVTHDRNAGEYFKKGVKSVFPQLNKYPSNNVEKAISYAYKGARCGLYHVGMTAPGIILTRNIDAALAFDSLNRGLAINPHLLVPFLASHFKGYVEQLRDPANTQIRNNFEKRFDYQSGLTL